MVADGGLIVGLRPHGKWGDAGVHREGRGNRADHSTTRIRIRGWGLLEVEKYKDGGDFHELLWVTKSQTQRKNLAANRKDPPRKVLGETSAKAQIENMCRRDGIPPPWQAGLESSFENPAKVEKDVTRRRALRNSQARESSASEQQPRKQRGLGASSNEPSDHPNANEQRLQRLEAMMIDMGEARKTLNKTMATMAEMLKDSCD
ncbi:hypothetical protein QQS21_011976 [Conoideocrella luteorostrata]|uniref:Uncharacterized protein n=1 Tax=Conoideocrella luteorostrata TaxID=1105319 RepID=A0AAJ0CC18_9HYPO|nr:hypothetical protein QQS21_011976 [Conoideocrella luteorostrata]